MATPQTCIECKKTNCFCNIYIRRPGMLSMLFRKEEPIEERTETR